MPRVLSPTLCYLAIRMDEGMNSNHGLEALVGELRQLLSPPTGFTSGARVFLPEDDESDDVKRVTYGLIAEGKEVLHSPRRWAKRWDSGRSLSDSDIDTYVAEAERDDFHRLDAILQRIFEWPRQPGSDSTVGLAAG